MISGIFHKNKSTKITKSGFTTEKWVTRTCDECGKIEECRLQVIAQGRKCRGKDIDLCRKCSNSIKYKPTVFSKTMEDAVNWSGGEQIDRGYLKVYVGDGKRVFKHVQIYEKYFGIKLSKNECIHHIDMDKLNNSISNLYLCKNKREHQLCHQSLQDMSSSLFGKSVWIDKKDKIYKTEYIKYDIIKGIAIPEKYSIFVTTHNSRKNRRNISYERFYIKTGCYKNVHTYKAEKIVGRKLYANECVHHIDCNSLNNDVNNLIILTRSEHSKIHKSLERCAIELYKKGLLIFNKGKYQIA